MSNLREPVHDNKNRAPRIWKSILSNSVALTLAFATEPLSVIKFISKLILGAVLPLFVTDSLAV